MENTAGGRKKNPAGLEAHEFHQEKKGGIWLVRAPGVEDQGTLNTPIIPNTLPDSINVTLQPRALPLSMQAAAVQPVKASGASIVQKMLGQQPLFPSPTCSPLQLLI